MCIKVISTRARMSQKLMVSGVEKATGRKGMAETTVTGNREDCC